MATKTPAKETSKGICHFCQSEIAKAKMTQHLKYCKQRMAAIATEAEKASESQKTRLFYIVVEGRYNPEYWMHIEVPASDTMADLDAFLRDIWLECCGHMSAFKVGTTNYSSEPEDFSFFENEEKAGEDESTVEEEQDDTVNEVEEVLHTLPPAFMEDLSADLLSEMKQLQSIDDFVRFLKEELDDYGIDDGFAMASTAALQGWDDPDLVRVLQGTIPEKGACDDETWDDEAREYANDLTKARLNVLERRGHWQEYLYLAQAEDQVQAYAIMLVRLGRIQEAVTYGLTNLRTTEVVLALAKALFEHNEQEHGLHIAEHGLTLKGFKAPLAKWLRDQAVAMGKKELALTSAEMAFREEVSLDNYLHVTQTAGEQWPQLRGVLLDYVRHKKSSYLQGQVDVFLHEGLIDDAIAALEPYTSHTLVERVVDAALQRLLERLVPCISHGFLRSEGSRLWRTAVTSRPDWAIQACREQAESIMDGRRAQYYDAAANWLAKARKAYHVMSREQEWRVYLNELLIRHGRKYKLIPMLKALQ